MSDFDTPPQMSDEDFTRELIRRLGRATADPKPCRLFLEAFRAQIDIPPTSQEDAFPFQIYSAQERLQMGIGGGCGVTFLGIINGLCGEIPDGELEGWGMLSIRLKADDGGPREMVDAFLTTERPLSVGTMKPVGLEVHEILNEAIRHQAGGVFSTGQRCRLCQRRLARTDPWFEHSADIFSWRGQLYSELNDDVPWRDCVPRTSV